MYHKKIETILILSLISIYLLISQTFSSHLSYSLPPVPVNSYTPIGSTSEYGTVHSIEHIDNYPIVFIGDSRTVGMETALTASHADLSDHSFLSKVGKGYQWLLQMSPELETIASTPHIIVLNMGVNDLGNIKQYETLYATYHETIWKNCPIYIVSVNPVRSPCHTVTNQRIESFNQQMQEFIRMQNASAPAEAFPIQYIDTYSYLQENGYQSRDGLHYASSTYLQIYHYILDAIQEPIGDGEGWYIIHSSSSPVETSYPRSSESNP